MHSLRVTYVPSSGIPSLSYAMSITFFVPPKEFSGEHQTLCEPVARNCKSARVYSYLAASQGMGLTYTIYQEYIPYPAGVHHHTPRFKPVSLTNGLSIPRLLPLRCLSRASLQTTSVWPASLARTTSSPFGHRALPITGHARDPQLVISNINSLQQRSWSTQNVSVPSSVPVLSRIPAHRTFTGFSTRGRGSLLGPQDSYVPHRPLSA